MLIICSGPDTWSARKKAKELLRAFRDKHDPQGFSISVMPEPDLASLLQQFGAPSLFSAKRFIRCDGLLEKIKVADSRLLAKRLIEDQDMTIVLTVEAEAIAAKTLEALKDAHVVTYAFPQSEGKAFQDWCVRYAAQHGVPEARAREVALLAVDTWNAAQMIEMCAANPQAEIVPAFSQEAGIFEVVEAFLRQKPWRDLAHDVEPDAFLATAISQVRSAIRVQDGVTQGLHPFVVKKLSGLRTPDIRLLLQRLIRIHVLQRSGYAVSDELTTLLP